MFRDGLQDEHAKCVNVTFARLRPHTHRRAALPPGDCLVDQELWRGKAYGVHRPHIRGGCWSRALLDNGRQAEISEQRVSSV